MEPNEIKSTYEKMLKVKTVGSKKHIIVDKELTDSKSQKNNTSHGGSVGADFKVVSLKASYNYAK